MTPNLSNIPNKGFADWLPEEYAIRKYIFDIYRKVCREFGYEEYLTPVLEPVEIYKAKSGEDVGGNELYTVTDGADRQFALRPEMTPSVTRLVTRIYEQSPKPLRLFSIANFFRYQKPQRGRNREFWQLNYDIFGSDSINADVEVVQIALKIMLAFNPPKGSFTLYLNSRKLIDEILVRKAEIPTEAKVQVVRILDKAEKLSPEEFRKRLEELQLSATTIDLLQKFINSKTKEELLNNFPDMADCEGFKEITAIYTLLQELGYGDWVTFNPSIIRGFDYYDGMVFEVFDNHPDNNRSLFGGGRYNGLASIFGGNSFPAVGCAPGDETMRLFLESWNLLPAAASIADVFVTVFSPELRSESEKIASQLRNKGMTVLVSLEDERLGKQIEFADKKGISRVVIVGPDEVAKGIVKVKDLQTGEEKSGKIEELPV